MKKHMIFAALAALCLTACNEEKQDSLPEVTTAAQTAAAETSSALTAETTAETAMPGAVTITIPEIALRTAEITMTAETAAAAETTVAAKTTAATIIMEAITTEPATRITQLEKKPLTSVPEADMMHPHPQQMLSYTEAFPTEIQKIVGTWYYLNPIDEDWYVDIRTTSELTVQADGSFTHYGMIAGERSALIGSGTVSVEDGEYVFRYDSAKEPLRAVPQTEDPLNCLAHIRGRGWFERADAEHIFYDRQFRRVKKMPQDGESVPSAKMFEETSWYSGGPLYLRMHDCGDLSGSFDFCYREELSDMELDNIITEEEYEEAIRKLERLNIKGSFCLEQGTDNTGKPQYYYNFYDPNGTLFMSIAANEMRKPVNDPEYPYYDWSFECDYAQAPYWCLGWHFCEETEDFEDMDDNGNYEYDE